MIQKYCKRLECFIFDTSVNGRASFKVMNDERVDSQHCLQLFGKVEVGKYSDYVVYVGSYIQLMGVFHFIRC